MRPSKKLFLGTFPSLISLMVIGVQIPALAAGWLETYTQGVNAQDKGDYHTAETLLKEARSGLEADGKHNQELANLLTHLGRTLYLEKNYAEAKVAYMAAVKLLRGLLPTNDPQVAKHLHNVIAQQTYLKEWPDAAKNAQEAAEIELANGQVDLTIQSLDFAADCYARASDISNKQFILRGMLQNGKLNLSDAQKATIQAKLDGTDGTKSAAPPDEIAKAALAMQNHDLPAAERILQDQLKKNEQDHDMVAVITLYLGMLRYMQGRSSEAEKLFKEALPTVEKILPDNPIVTMVHSIIGRTLQREGRNKEAEAELESSLAAARTKSDWSNTLSIMNMLGGLYQDEGKYNKAEETLRESLKLAERELSPQNPIHFQAINNLALVVSSLGRYTEAETLQRESLKLLESAPNHDIGEVGTACGNLAMTLESLGRYKEAKAVCQRAIDIDSKQADRTKLPIDQTNMASLLMDEGRYDESEKLYRLVLAEDEKNLGAIHPNVATDLSNLAGLLKKTAQFEEAEKLSRKALAMRQKLLGDSHPDIADALMGLANTLASQGRFEESIGFYHKAIAIREKSLGANHPLLATSLSSLGDTYIDCGRFEEAEPILTRALNIRQRAYGATHPDVADSLMDLGHLNKNRNNYAQAEALYKRALEIRKAVFGPTHVEVGVTLNDLAILLSDQKKYDEAESLYKQSLTIQKAVYGEKHPQVAVVMGNLANLYISENKIDEAIDFEHQALVLKESKFGSMSPEVSGSVWELGTLRLRQGKFDDAESLLRRAKKIDDDTFGLGGKFGPNRLLSIARDLRFAPLQDLSKSAALDTKSPTVGLTTRLASGKSSVSDQVNAVNTATARLSDKIAISAKELNELSLLVTAIAYSKPQQNVLTLFERIKSSQEAAHYNDIFVAHNLLQISVNLESLGTSGLEPAQQSLGCLEKVMGENPSGNFSDNFSNNSGEKLFVADTLVDLSFILARRQDLINAKKAAGLASRTLSMVPTSHSDIAERLLHLATFYRFVGDYFSAQETLDRVSSELSAPTDAKSALCARCELERAELEFQIGDYERARDSANRALTLMPDLSEDHVRCLELAFRSSTSIYEGSTQSVAQRSDSLSAAMRQGNECLDACKRLNEKEMQSKIAPAVLSTLAYLMAESGDKSGATKALLEVISLTDIKSADIDTRRWHGVALTELGTLALADGDLPGAQAQFAQAVQIHNYDPSPAGVLLTSSAESWLAECYHRQQNDPLAQQHALTSAFILDKYIATGFAQLSLAEQCAFIDQLSAPTARLVAICSSGQRMPEFYKYLMRWKGSLIRSLSQQAAIMKVISNRPDLRSLYDDYSAKVHDLDKLSEHGTMQSLQQLQTAMMNCERAERKLTAAGGVSSSDPIQKMNAAGLCGDTIAKDECLIDLYTFTAFNSQTHVQEDHYGAFLVGDAILAVKTTGIGVQLLKTDRGIEVVKTLAGSPSETAGLAAKDVITEVDGKPLKDKSLVEATQMIRGDVGSSVALVIQRNDSSLNFTLHRAAVAQGTKLAFVDLGLAKPLRDSIHAWLSELSDPSVASGNLVAAQNNSAQTTRSIGISNPAPAHKPLGTSSSEMQRVWDSLHDHMGPSITKVWLCPDGEFSRIPWNILSSNIDITQVDSPRELVDLKKRAPKTSQKESVLTVGGIDFGDPDIPPLPKTLTEVNAISSCATRFNFQSKTMLGSEPTRLALQQNLPTVTIAHVATHGFFANSKDAEVSLGASNTRALPRSALGEQGAVVSRNPLLASGILVANDQVTKGAKHRSEALTAQDILNLNLSQCKLMTLSACETGRGSEYTGQGVLGLRSAIISAGCDCVLMSLWKVDDDATCFLMERFYENLWSGKEGMTPSRALATAQKSVREKAGWENPYYWAAWTLAGRVWQ